MSLKGAHTMEGEKYTKLKTALLKLPKKELMNILDDTYKAMQSKHGFNNNKSGSTPQSEDKFNITKLRPNLTLKTAEYGNASPENNKLKGPVKSPVPNFMSNSPGAKLISPLNTKPNLVENKFNTMYKELPNMQSNFPKNTTLMKNRQPPMNLSNMVQPLPPAAELFAPKNRHFN